MLYNGSVFKNRKFDLKKLKSFGFKLSKDCLVYKTLIIENSFEMTIKINQEELIDVRLIETATGEDYNLIFVKNAEGEFIGKVREAFENVLINIKDECTYFSAFKSEYANLIIKYIKEKYNNDAEFLWEKFPDNCIFRRNDKKGKWYAALLTVAKNKLGLEGNEIIEIIDLKAAPETITTLVDNKKIFNGYHMNKKHWFTICLDGSVDIEEIKKFIDNSYNLL